MKIGDQKTNRKDFNWKKDYDLKIKWATCWSGAKRIATTTQILVKFLSSKDEDHVDRKKQKGFIQRKKPKETS